MVVISATVRAIRHLRRQRYVFDVVGILCNLIALFLLASSTYVVVFLTIRPWLGLTSAKGFALVVWSLLLVGLASWAYARAIFTNPGTAAARRAGPPRHDAANPGGAALANTGVRGRRGAAAPRRLRDH